MDGKIFMIRYKALAAHRLHQDGQVQNAAARDLDAALVLELLDLHGHVVLGLVEQALLELTGTHDVAVAADERGGRSLKDDGQGRRVDLDGFELNGVLGIGVDIADIGAVCILVNGCFWHGHEGCNYYVVPKSNTRRTSGPTSTGRSLRRGSDRGRRSR